MLVLGSTCFAKRYGGATVLGQAQYGGGGGRKLTDDERQMLVQNTEALLAHFEALAAAEAEAATLAFEQARLEELQHKQQMLDKLQRLRAVYEERQTASTRKDSLSLPGLAKSQLSPWHWQKERTSIALLKAPGGANWVRVQHRDGSQKLVPWPQFEGWEHALPAEVGVPDISIGAIAVVNIVEAIRILKQNGFDDPVVGSGQDVLPR